MRIGFVLCLMSCVSLLHAAQIDTIVVHSPSMGKDIKATVVLPDEYDHYEELSVVYLLHGYSDNYKYWIGRLNSIQEVVDAYKIIMVFPDGGFSSWYMDSPVDEAYKYETFISRELVPFIDRHFKTRDKPEGRAVTGYSMGGHGALYVSFRNRDVFGAAGSMSGGVDIRPFPNNWDLKKRLGTIESKPENWEYNTVINQTHLIEDGKLALIIDCGTGDFFYQVNLDLHEKLEEEGVPHDFISRPGKHNFSYWDSAVKYQMLFFKNYFEENQ